MSDKVCMVENCNEPGSVDLSISENGVKREIVICQKCWEDLNFHHVALKFKESTKS